MFDEKIIPGAIEEPVAPTPALDPNTTVEEDVEEVVVDETQEQDPEPELPVYTKEQVESAVKMRVGTINKKVEKLKPFETAVKRMSEITGLTPEALIARLESLSDVEQAKILNVSPQELQRRRQADQVARTLREQTETAQRNLEKQTLMADPKYKDFDLYEEEIKDILSDNPKLTMKQAYVLAKGETPFVRDAEQRAVAKMTKSSNQRVVKPGAVSGGTPTPKIDQTTIAAARRVGMDPAEYVAYGNISDYDSYQRYMASKKGAK